MGVCCNQIRPSQSIKIKIYRLFQIHLVFRRFLIKCNRFIVLISLSWLLHKINYNKSWVILIYKLIEDLTTYLFGIIKVRKEKACLMGVWGMVTWRGDQFHELFYAEAEVVLNLWIDQMQNCKINGWIINSKNLAQIFVFVLLTWANRQFIIAHFLFKHLLVWILVIFANFHWINQIFLSIFHCLRPKS